MSTGCYKKSSDAVNDNNKIRCNLTVAPPKMPADSKLKESNTRLKSIQVISRKSSSKIMKFNCTQQVQGQMLSERRKKQFELQKIYSSTSSTMVNSNFKAGSKIRANLDNSINLKEFCFSIDRELDFLERSETAQAEEYLKILEKLTQKDEQFKHLLLKVIKGMEVAIKKLDSKGKSFEKTENKLSTVKSFNLRKNNSEDFVLLSKREINFSEKDNVRRRQTEKNQKIYTRKEETFEKYNLEKTIQEQRQEIESLKQKESKFELLIKAMKDRGYPVEQVYATDVLHLKQNTSKNEDCEGEIYINENPYSLSSDISQEME